MQSCTDSYLGEGGAYSCGRCAACLSKRRRTWAHRIMLETKVHDGKSSFVTLTYQTAPRSHGDLETLEPHHLRDFWKRLRKNTGATLRYFAVGEYGERSGRPHYHAALWGLAPCAGGPNQRIGNTAGFLCLCKTCSDVRLAWGFGHVMVATLSEKSAMYIAGYVVKKMTNSSDPRLFGRAPEFSRMSLRPGIGATAIKEIAAACTLHNLTVPVGLRHGSKILPLGRYLRRKIAEKLCDGSPEQMAEVLGTRQALTKSLEAMRLLREYAWSNEVLPKEVLREITPTLINRSKNETL